MGDDFSMGAESCHWISMQTVAPLYPKCAISQSDDKSKVSISLKLEIEKMGHEHLQVAVPVF